MNVTLDDNSPQLAYSPEWRVQPPDGQDNALFFQSTYHAVEESGASMTLTFNGTGIWLYGSKGPFHGQYSVQYTDGQTNAIENFSGFSATMAYQQVLFGRLLGKGVHTIALRNIVTASDQSFLDIDYVVVQNDSPATTTNPGFLTSTPKPKGIVPTPTSGSAVSSNGSQTYNPVLMALTIVFGTLTALGLLGLLIYLIRRRRRKAAQQQQVGSRRSRLNSGSDVHSRVSRAPSAAATLQFATQKAWKEEDRGSRAFGVTSKASRAVSPSSGSVLTMTERSSGSPVTARGHAPNTARDIPGRSRGHTPGGSRDLVTSGLVQQNQIDSYLRGERGRQHIPVGVGAAVASGESYPLVTFPSSSSSTPRTQSPGGQRALSPPPRHVQSPTLGYLHHEMEPESPPLTYQPLSPTVPAHPPLPGVAERHPLLPSAPRSPITQLPQSPQSPHSPQSPASPHNDRYSGVPSSRLDRNSSFNLTAAERSAISRVPERHFTPRRQPPSVPQGSRPYSLGKMPEEFLATPVGRTERLESVSEAGSSAPLRKGSVSDASRTRESPQRGNRPPPISTGREYLTAPGANGEDDAVAGSFTPDERSFTGSSVSGRTKDGLKGLWRGKS